MLPGICVDLDREKRKMSVAVVDVNKIGQSSLFSKTLFGLRVLSVKPKSLKNLNGVKLHRLDLKTLFFKYVELWKEEIVSLNSMDNTYIIEVRKNALIDSTRN